MEQWLACPSSHRATDTMEPSKLTSCLPVLLAGFQRRRNPKTALVQLPKRQHVWFTHDTMPLDSYPGSASDAGAQCTKLFSCTTELLGPARLCCPGGRKTRARPGWPNDWRHTLPHRSSPSDPCQLRVKFWSCSQLTWTTHPSGAQ